MGEKNKNHSSDTQSLGLKTGLTTLWLLEKMPLQVSRKFGSLLGLIYYVVNKKRRKIAKANIRLCFPQLAEKDRKKILVNSYKYYGQGIVDLGSLWWSSDDKFNKLVEYKGLEHFDDARQSGKAIILLTSHKPATDFAGVAMSSHGSMVSMMKPMKSKTLDQLFIKGRTRFGARMVMREQGLRLAIQSMRNYNQAFYYIPDEDFGEENTVFAPFFSIQRATLNTLGRLSRITGAVVIPCFGHITDAGYRVILDSPLENFPCGDGVQDATRMNQAFEKDIRRAPEQYIWTFKWFKTRPEGEPDIYE